VNWIPRLSAFGITIPLLLILFSSKFEKLVSGIFLLLLAVGLSGLAMMRRRKL
jgi:hypothetical protein